jgi:hypothetical protein
MAARAWLVGVLVTVAGVAISAQQREHGAGPAERLGTVHFETSCSRAAQPAFDRAVALLYSFEFARAIDGFEGTLRADPACAMAFSASP